LPPQSENPHHPSAAPGRDITTDLAAATVPALLSDVDGKSVTATTARTWAASFSLSRQLDAATINDILNTDGTRCGDVLRGDSHDRTLRVRL
jgi:hypothetical protein